MVNAEGTPADSTRKIIPQRMTFLLTNQGRGNAAIKECLREADTAGVNALLLQKPYIGSKGSVTSTHRVIQDMRGNSLIKATVVVLDPKLGIVLDPQL